MPRCTPTTGDIMRDQARAAPAPSPLDLVGDLCATLRRRFGDDALDGPAGVALDALVASLAPAPTTPGGWTEAAAEHEKAGRWTEAAAAHDHAADCTFGDGRRDRSRDAAARCRANVDPLATSTPTARPGRPTVTRTRR